MEPEMNRRRTLMTVQSVKVSREQDHFACRNLESTADGHRQTPTQVDSLNQVAANERRCRRMTTSGWVERRGQRLAMAWTSVTERAIS
jgi:hypothetical protein